MYMFYIIVTTNQEINVDNILTLFIKFKNHNLKTELNH